MSDEPPLVLVVEDEPDLADLYATWLSKEYRVETAYGGHEALDVLDEEVAVVLLDRRMPGLSGDEVLAVVRERDIDCRVAMVTAVEPDFDIVEMGFDDYLVKPVTKDALEDTVSSLVTRSSYDEGVRELFSLASKKALLESEKRPAELEDSEEYAALDARVNELREELDRTLEETTDHDSFVGFYRDIDRDDGEDGDGADSESA